MTRLLIVDPDDGRRNEIGEALARHGFSVAFAECGLFALEILAGQDQDLLLCSEALQILRLPDLLDIVKNDPALSDLPVIVYGRSARRKAEAAMAGADDYFTYPFDFEKLASRIGGLTQQGASSLFHGELGVVTLPDVIQMLTAARCVGQLQIATQGGSAEMFFNEGQIFFAKLNELAGEEAILTTMRFTKTGGVFTFTPQLPEPPPEPNIDKRTDHVLLHLASVLDEGA